MKTSNYIINHTLNLCLFKNCLLRGIRCKYLVKAQPFLLFRILPRILTVWKYIDVVCFWDYADLTAGHCVAHGLEFFLFVVEVGSHSYYDSDFVEGVTFSVNVGS